MIEQKYVRTLGGDLDIPNRDAAEDCDDLVAGDPPLFHIADHVATDYAMTNAMLLRREYSTSEGFLRSVEDFEIIESFAKAVAIRTILDQRGTGGQPGQTMPQLVIGEF